MTSSLQKVCSLPWCRQTGSHLKYRSFPDNEIRQMQWLTLLDVAETWKDVPPDKICSYVLCSLHFDTRGNLLRATSTPLVTTAHYSASKEDVNSIDKPSKPVSRKRRRDFDEADLQNGQSSSNSVPAQIPSHVEPPPPLPSLTKCTTERTQQVYVPRNPDNRKPAFGPILTGPLTREAFSLEKKMEVVRLLQSGMKQSDVCRVINIRKSTVWTIWKNRDKIEKAFMSNAPQRKKLRKSVFDDVDAALYKWYNSVAPQNVTITGRLLQTMAESFAEDLGKTSFVCTSGWLERFKQRYCIVLSPHNKKAKKGQEDCVESGGLPLEISSVQSLAVPSELSCLMVPASSPNAEDLILSDVGSPDNNIHNASMTESPCASSAEDSIEIKVEYDELSAYSPLSPEIAMSTTPLENLNDKSVQATDWLQYKWPKCKRFPGPRMNQEYPPSDIFTADETGILYRISPESSWKIIKNKHRTPFNVAEERITVVLCGNADGTEKSRLLIVGQFKKPPCVSSVVGSDFSRLPADYCYTPEPNSWVTVDVVSDWLQSWDQELEMEERKILLLLKSSAAHEGLPKLKNIKIVLIPHKVSGDLLPFQQGVLKEFKFRYRKLQLQRMIYYLEQGKPPLVSLLDAILMLSTAWSEVPSIALAASFCNAGIVTGLSNLDYSYNEFDSTLLLDQALQAGVEIPVGWEFKDFVKVDDCLCAVESPPSQNILPDSSPPRLEISSSNNLSCEVNGASVRSLEDLLPLPGGSHQSQSMNAATVSLATAEIQSYLDVIRMWAMSRGEPCPPEIHDALSKLESFANS